MLHWLLRSDTAGACHQERLAPKLLALAVITAATCVPFDGLRAAGQLCSHSLQAAVLNGISYQVVLSVGDAGGKLHVPAAFTRAFDWLLLQWQG